MTGGGPVSTVLIVGASTRAAAFSALRAGLSPVCIDLFADRDLAAACSVTRVPPGRYPRGIAVLARRIPPSPWMYTGGLENHPDLIACISENRPLWGNGPEALRKARDPFGIAEALAAAGMPCLDVYRSADALPTGRWLVKPLAGAGGVGIRFADRRPPGAGTYHQRYTDGEPHAAVYVVDGDGVRLLGVTRQLVGCDWLHTQPFRYCGSLGTFAGGEEWRRLGEVVANYAGLRGVFGIDAVVRDGVPWLVEVNPRYTASVEVVEYGTGSNALTVSRVRIRKPRAVAKGVYYAPANVVVPAGPWDDAVGAPPDRVPPFADIPACGERIAAGRPVMTLFAADEAGLRAAAAELDRRLLR